MSRQLNRRAFLQTGALAAGSVALADAVDAEPRPDNRTNLLFIMSDQHRGDAMGCENHPIVKTPRLDKLASEGVRFSRTYCQAPLCVPSRACMMTARYAHLNRCTDNGCRLPESEYTWAELLRDQGYTTVAVGKTHGIDDGLTVIPTSAQGCWPAGLVGYANQPGINAGTSLTSAEDFFDARIVDAGIEQLRAFKQAGKPWALFVGIHAPHPPLYPPKPFDTMYDAQAMPLPPFRVEDLERRPSWQRATYHERFSNLTDDDKRRMIAAYFGLVSYIDQQIGRVLDELARLDMDRNTVVVYVADHGDCLGEHGLFAKYASMYEGEVRVPGMIRFPGRVPAGHVVDKPIETIDLIPTMLALMGAPALEGIQGRNLQPLIAGDAGAARPFVFAEIAESHNRAGVHRGLMLRTEQWKLCHYTNEPGELYDLEDDPHELHNLYPSRRHRAVRAELTEMLLNHVAQSQEAPANLARRP